MPWKLASSRAWGIAEKAAPRVLTAVVIAAGGFALRNANASTQTMRAFVGTISVAGLLTLLFYLRASRTKLSATIAIYLCDAYPNAPLIFVSITNPASIPVPIAAVEFTTKGQWDIPDIFSMGNSRPVVGYLEEGSAYIKVSDIVGSTASKAVAKTIPPLGDLGVRFHLITDHSPGDGLGIFPFHLGVSVIYGPDNARLAMKDILVSIHGHIALSASTFETPVLLNLPPGEIRHNANAALRRVAEGALCPPELTTILKNVAR